MKIKYVVIISMMAAVLLLVACKPGEKDDVVEESSALAGEASGPKVLFQPKASSPVKKIIPTEVCDNNIDDDFDGKIDCEENYCTFFVAKKKFGNSGYSVEAICIEGKRQSCSSGGQTFGGNFGLKFLCMGGDGFINKTVSSDSSNGAKEKDKVGYIFNECDTNNNRTKNLVNGKFSASSFSNGGTISYDNNLCVNDKWLRCGPKEGNVKPETKMVVGSDNFICEKLSSNKYVWAKNPAK